MKISVILRGVFLARLKILFSFTMKITSLISYLNLSIYICNAFCIAKIIMEHDWKVSFTAFIRQGNN